MSSAPIISPEELVQLLATQPPRPVSRKLKRHLYTGHLLLIFFGTFFFLFGIPFLYIFFPWQAVDEWRLSQSSASQTEARIVDAEKTNSRESKIPVWCYHFTFRDGSGAEFHGKCYHTGEKWKKGNRAQVRYIPDNPQVACLVDARLSHFSILAGFVVIFPTVGVTMMILALRSLRHRLYLVTRGKLGDFLIVGVKPTNVKINNQSQYKITLQSLDGSVSKPLIFKTHISAEIRFAEDRHRRNEKVFALFNPHKPKHALLPEFWAL